MSGPVFHKLRGGFFSAQSSDPIHPNSAASAMSPACQGFPLLTPSSFPASQRRRVSSSSQQQHQSAGVGISFALAQHRLKDNKNKPDGTF